MCTLSQRQVYIFEIYPKCATFTTSKRSFLLLELDTKYEANQYMGGGAPVPGSLDKIRRKKMPPFASSKMALSSSFFVYQARH
jgi:hypothetical protein